VGVGTGVAPMRAILQVRAIAGSADLLPPANAEPRRRGDSVPNCHSIQNSACFAQWPSAMAVPQERSAARSDGEALGAAVLFFGCCDESDYLFKSAALTVARMRRRPALADPPTIRSFGARRSLVDAAHTRAAGWLARTLRG
jgi:hypothetical protein